MIVLIIIIIIYFQVPKGLSATHVVQAIRTRFFNNHREVEFMCVCDTLKENSTILEELNDAQVSWRTLV